MANANANPNNAVVANEREERAYRILRAGLTQVNNLRQTLVDPIANAIRDTLNDNDYNESQQMTTQHMKEALHGELEENGVSAANIASIDDNIYSEILGLYTTFIGQKNGDLDFPLGVGGRRLTKGRRRSTRNKTKKTKKSKTKKTKSVRSKKQRTQ